MNDPKADLKVTVEAIFGDPDLFISRTDQHPDQVNHISLYLPVSPLHLSLYLPVSRAPTSTPTR